MTLSDILEATRAESRARQDEFPLSLLRRSVQEMGPARGFANALRRNRFSVIAEIKRRSPSMGLINQDALDYAHHVYADHPVVSAISVLTQNQHFGGSIEDLKIVSADTQAQAKPILRKDFIFSEYEVYFSRWVGADAILLMANVVEDKGEFRHLHDLARSIGLDVLCEVHEESEIALLPASVRICGINARRFKGVSQRTLAAEGGASTETRDTQTDLATFDLFARLPEGCIRVAESGISSDNIAAVLGRYPFNAGLIGTSLLKMTREKMPLTLTRIQEEAEKALGYRTEAGKARVPVG